MLALDPMDIYGEKSIILKNKRAGKYTFSKAYSMSDRAELVLYVERTLGVFSPKLSIRADGMSLCRTEEFFFLTTDGMYDVYSLSFDVSDICREPTLLYYKVCFSIGDNTMTFGSKNNVDGFLSYGSHEPADEFKMLVYDSGYETPGWFRDGLMYHIFVDRFCRGSTSVPIRHDAVMNDDWYDGIPQYGNIPGDFCSNNMFFGGTLYGICEKLDYLESLGVSVLYLSPIFEAYSNHKYDTGDYSRVDDMFGGDAALDKLIAECEKRGMRVILDGVFNHTGDDSVYFNKYGRYGDGGAYADPDSEYRSWYRFRTYPNDYESWWGIEVLPKLATGTPEVEEFLAGENGIAAKWLKKGVSGFRLDVADELPDSFLFRLNKTLKGHDKNTLILGEVWENAADKCAYGSRRLYFRGKQLDGVMNYPIKDGIVSYISTGNVKNLYDAVCDIYSSYPAASSLSLMNILGTHDTERILTVLGTNRHIGMCGDELAEFKMTPEEYARGAKKLVLASVLQYTLPGVPSVFYGDEAGVMGGRDPFCRKTYPWGREDKTLTDHYIKLGAIRRKEKALCRGELEILTAQNGVFAFSRSYAKQKITVIINMSGKSFFYKTNKKATELYSKKSIVGCLEICPESFAVVKE